jgi:hypothetical protein
MDDDLCVPAGELQRRLSADAVGGSGDKNYLPHEIGNEKLRMTNYG